MANLFKSMANLFKSKKDNHPGTNSESVAENNDATVETTFEEDPRLEIIENEDFEGQTDITIPHSQEEIDEAYFGKSLSFLSEEKNKLGEKIVALEEVLMGLTKEYSEMLEKRKKVSVEQQQALSDFNEASLGCLEKELPQEKAVEVSNIGSENDASLDQKKSMLQGMKDVENEKEGISAQLDQVLFEMAEKINAARAEIDAAYKALNTIEKSINTAGDEDTETDDPTDEYITIKGRKFKVNRKIANKVRGINFLNLPTYLKNDCEIDYAVSKLIINYVIAFIAIALIGVVYSLKIPYVLILCLIYFLFGPSLVYFHHRKKYEKKKFQVCVRYVEQMIFSFTRRSKLLDALKETRVLMTGKVGDAIDLAIATIQHGKNNTNIYKDALKQIEEVFPCARVKNLHELLIDVERIGGKHTASLDIMLEDVREWDVRTNNFQAEQSVKGMSMIISICMSLGVCLFMTNVLPDDMGGDISGFGLYQIISTLSLVIMFFIYRLSARKLTSSWVNDDLGEDEARIEADIDAVKKYAANPDGKIKPILAMTRVQTAMEKAFPRWVVRFALLASSRPIPVALTESIEGAPLAMRRELLELSDRLEQDPNSIQPYIEFFKDFELPQVRSMMMMVYSLGSSDANDIDRHILSIVKRNHLLQATAEKIEYDEKMAMFTLFSTVPMLLACVIMMLDVGMIVLNMLNTVL